MTLSDDELGSILTETFRQHERPSDADVARRIARAATASHRAHRGWPAIAACAAATAIVAGSASVLVRHDGIKHPPAISSNAAGNVEAIHRADASTLLQRLVEWPQLPNAQTAAAAPSPMLRTPAVQPLDSDAVHQLHDTAFWTVPHASVSDLVRALSARSAPIDGTSAQQGRLTGAANTDLGAVMTTTVTWQADGHPNDGTDSYTAPTLELMLVQVGTDVDIRADAWTSWRPARPSDSIVGGRVTSVRVSYQPPGVSQGAARSVVLTDPATIRRLAAMVNGLRTLPPGGVMNCPAVPAVPEVAMISFTSAAGSQTFSSVSCPASVVSGSSSQGVQLEPKNFVAMVKTVSAGHA